MGGWIVVCKTTEVRRTVDDLRRLLAEEADRAAQQARAPGAAVAVHRARTRRRWAAATVCALLVAVAAASIGLNRGFLQVPTIGPLSNGDDPRDTLPWRPLVPKEWSATVPDERPVAPVLVAAKGTEAGQPWRLTVYRSVFQKSGQPAETDVCYILEWFTHDSKQWQANGTCAAATQTSTVLAVGGPETGRIAVIGRVPKAATRIRLELPGQGPVEAKTVDTTPDLGGRFYVAFVPRSAHLQRMVALDDAGRQVGQATGQGDLTAAPPTGYPPTGPVKVVLRVTSPLGPVTITAWPTRFGYCLDVDTDSGGGESSCDGAASTTSVLDPEAGCPSSGRAGEPTVQWARVLGGVPRTARTVRVEVAGKQFEVPAHDAGEAFDRAFFLAELPVRKKVTAVRLSALDANHQPIRTWRTRTTTYRCR
jgi:hypothetical protein